MRKVKKLLNYLLYNPAKLFSIGLLEFMRIRVIRLLIPAKLFIKFEYKLYMGKNLNIENPKTFNEKLQWLKLYDQNPLYTKLADKYEVRQYVREKIGEQYLVPLIGVYDSVEDIPFNELPGQYVLKCTHDSGTAIIKNAANKMSDNDIKYKLKKAIKRDYYYEHREWGYKHIKPRIICEQLIKTQDNNPPRDYKIFCFDGEPKFLFVASDRGSGTKFDFFDMNWNKYPLMQHYPNSNYDIHKPKKWKDMVDCARKLSQGFTHVRVDFYIDIEDKVFFGEMTFCHMGAFERFEPEEYDEYFGRFIKLPGE